MKVNKFLIATGALVLTVAGAIAGRSSAKFSTQASSIYLTGGVVGTTCTAALTGATGTSAFFTTGGTGSNLNIVLGANTYHAYGTAACGSTHRLHFNND